MINQKNVSHYQADSGTTNVQLNTELSDSLLTIESEEDCLSYADQAQLA
jgi:hypothetical protein